MKRFAWVILGWLAILATAQAASFDCAKAETVPEKLICTNPKISELDDELDKAYKYILNGSPSGSAQLVLAQRSWLKTKRNKCQNEACLIQAYSTRIKEINDLDPLADSNITCEEMRKFPDIVFQEGIDLGSGHGSPTAVDYRCPESLASLPYVTKLRALAETIRSEDGPQLCTGSIIHAHWRYYHFDLARAGYAPNLIEHEHDSDVLKYFEQWSWESPYNNKLYKEFFSEFDKALPVLAEHYRKQFHFSVQESQKLARAALMIIADRAAGTFPASILNEPSELIDVAHSEKSTLSDLKSVLANLPQEQDSKDQAYYALKIALYSNKPEAFISMLTSYIGKAQNNEIEVGDESALFATLANRHFVELLLNKGESIDYANSFGKTALYYAIQFNDHELVSTLLRRGANVNHTYKSAKELNPDNDSCGADTYIKHTKRTPLMHAAQNSDVEMLKLLLKNGARLNDVDEIEFSAFDYAIMGAKPENTAYLKAIGGRLSNPIYPSDAANQELPISVPSSSSSVLTNGYINKLAISPQRPGILVASIIPYDKLVPDENHGLYIFSILNPNQPQPLAHFPLIKPSDFALSPDGKTAYVMNMGFNGAPVDRKYGLLVIDISNPATPRLIDFIAGDFMTMHLSYGGKRLYLQERDLPSSPSRGLMVFSTEQEKANLLCSNPFGETKYKRRPFAYSFATFPDEALIAINEQMGGVNLYDVTNSCNAKKLLQTSDEKLGNPIIGYAHRTVITVGGGVASYKIADTLTKISSWSGSASNLYINNQLGILAATFGNEVALSTLDAAGGFLPTARYSFGVNIGSMVLASTGWLYVGTNGKLISVRTSYVK
ncbi:MAG: ankyrin repeat domain-containing protein [Nitrosomonadales bacterium]|nr:ankyrin repeat domain-containing protein [Nitrosomonadales bacterium]